MFLLVLQDSIISDDELQSDPDPKMLQAKLQEFMVEYTDDLKGLLIDYIIDLKYKLSIAQTDTEIRTILEQLYPVELTTTDVNITEIHGTLSNKDITFEERKIIMTASSNSDFTTRAFAKGYKIKSSEGS